MTMHPARTIGIRELKTRTSQVLREVQAGGAEFVITLRGRPIARLEPWSDDHAAPPTDGMGGLRGALTDLPRLNWDDFAEVEQLWEPRPIDGDG